MMLDVDSSKMPSKEFNEDELLNISIGVTGDYIGEIAYKFPINTSLSVVNIMSGMDITSIDEFVTSAVSEIANIISGNFLMLLAQTNVKCDILPPVICEDTNDKEYEINQDVFIFTAAGEVYLDIRLNPSK